MRLTPLFLIIALLANPTEARRKRAPEWVENPPSSTTAYIGVYKVRKKSFKKDRAAYENHARLQALTKISSAISITIESTVESKTAEYRDNFHNNFLEDIKSSTAQILTGYEIVDTWENRKYYAVYYKLDKKVWHRVQQIRLAQSEEKAMLFFKEGYRALDAKDPLGAMQSFAQAYLAVEPTLYLFPIYRENGREVPMITMLDANMQLLLADITIDAGTPLFAGQRVSYSNNPPAITVRYKGTPVKNYPLIVMADPVVTSAHGTYSIPAQKLQGIPNHTVTITTDDTEILQGLKKESPALTAWLTEKRWPRATTTISFTPPSFYITSIESNMGKSTSPKQLQNSLKDQITSQGFSLASSRKRANYTIEVIAHTRHINSYNNIHFVYLDITWSIYDTMGREITRRSLEPIKGSGANELQAGFKAFQAGRSILADEISLWVAQNL